MQPRRFVIPVVGALTVLALSAAAVAQTKARPTQPQPNTFTITPQVQAPGRNLSVLTTRSADPRAARMGQYPMPIARTDVSRFNMPVTGGAPVNYPIRIVRPEGEAIALETAPPAGVPVEPKLLEPVRLKLAPASPPASK